MPGVRRDETAVAEYLHDELANLRGGLVPWETGRLHAQFENLSTAADVMLYAVMYAMKVLMTCELGGKWLEPPSES